MKTVALALVAVTSVCICADAHGNEDRSAEIETALMAWTAPKMPEKPEELDARLQRLRPWAEAMADVCTDRADCTLLAAQAFVETRFVVWAVDQRCNDPMWLANRRGWERRACDGGLAFGPWQVHDERFRGASPAFQASVVHERMHANPQAWTTWRSARSHAAWWLSGVAPETASR